MTRDDLNFFKEWFSGYCRTFSSGELEDQKNIDLKKRHTLKVCENITEISERLSLDENRRLLAEAVALFHDIGRFPQYAEYKTFRDSISVNHGLLGAKTLRETRVLHNLSSEEQETIIQSVMFHNAFAVPQKMREGIIFFVKLIRDADKLDIWRVFLEHYEGAEESRASAVGLGLPELPEYSEEVLSQLHERRIVSLSAIRSLNDFKLLQLSWIFDLNFIPSFVLVSERKYIERIAAHLPATEPIRGLSAMLNGFVRERISDLQEDRR